MENQGLNNESTGIDWLTVENDKYTRLYADFENYKKRHQKEKEEIARTIKTNMLDAILDLDNDLHIAEKSLPSDGLKLILSKLDTFLKKQGIEYVQDSKYDPDLHEVISMVGDGQGDPKIIDVISRGYLLNGKIIRYPKVILSK